MNKFKKYMVGKLLKYIAWVAIPICLKINRHYVKKVYGNSKGYDLSSAISLDKWANREFRTGLNYLMLTKDSKHHFGDINETMSSVFGKNQRDRTLTKKGLKWANWLDRIDKNHCKNSINLKVDYRDKDFEFIKSKI